MLFRINLIFLLLFCVFEVSAADLNRANRFMKATLYEDAIIQFNEILENETDPQPEIVLALVEAHYRLGKYEDALKLLDRYPQSKENDYFRAICWQQLGNLDKSIDLLSQYVIFSDGKYLEKALFSIGTCYQKVGELEKAKISFEKIQSNTDLFIQAQFALAQIELNREYFEAARTRLEEISSHCKKDNDVYQRLFLLGKSHYLQGEVKPATTYLLKALPESLAKNQEWTFEALEYLGRCYLETKKYTKASATFEKLVNLDPREETMILYGQSRLYLSAQEKDPVLFSEATKLLLESDLIQSVPSKRIALLECARFAPNFEKRDYYYQILVQQGEMDDPIIKTGWYEKGVNDYQEAVQLIQYNDRVKAKVLLEDAAEAFGQVIPHLMNGDQKKAQKAILAQADALSLIGTTEGWIQAYQNLSHWSQHLDSNQRDEFLYQQGLIASYLLIQKKKSEYRTLAIEPLEEIVKTSNSSSRLEDAEFLLGTIYFQIGEYRESERYFVRIIKRSPESKLSGEALFWTSRCKELLQEDPELICQIRQQVYRKFPDCRFADEAYFTSYPYQEYVQGDRKPLKHLISMVDRFPDSPFLINAHYLLGMDAKRSRKSSAGKSLQKKNLPEASKQFEMAAAQFDRLFEKGLLPKENLSYFTAIRYQAAMERGIVHLEIAKQSNGTKKEIYLEYAEREFSSIQEDFLNTEHPLLREIYAGEPYPQLHQESGYWLAQTFLTADQTADAEEIFHQMLDRYKKTKITRGYFLSRIWYELGKIAMKQEEFRLALDYLKQADDTGKGKVLSNDERLDIWIQQSHCYLALGETNEAMLCLSDVINSSAVSGLRLKAMYLRAEIYEQQDRPELARNQLEAMAKKGGNWAQKAKEKLENDYGKIISSR